MNRISAKKPRIIPADRLHISHPSSATIVQSKDGRNRRPHVSHFRIHSAHTAAACRDPRRIAARAAGLRTRSDRGRNGGAAHHCKPLRVRSLSVGRHRVSARDDRFGPDLRQALRHLRPQVVFPRRTDYLRRRLGVLRSLGPASFADRRHESADSVPGHSGHRRGNPLRLDVHHRRRHLLADRAWKVPGNLRRRVGARIDLRPHAGRISNRPLLVALGVLREPAGGRDRRDRDLARISVVPPAGSSQKGRLCRSGHAHVVPGAAAARVHLGDGLRLDVRAGRVATGICGGHARGVPLRGNESVGAGNPSGAILELDHRNLLGCGVRARHGDVRHHHISAVVHAGRDGRVGDAIRLAADASDDGRSRRKHCRGTIHFADGKI